MKPVWNIENERSNQALWVYDLNYKFRYALFNGGTYVVVLDDILVEHFSTEKEM